MKIVIVLIVIIHVTNKVQNWKQSRTQIPETKARLSIKKVEAPP
jgi:hypothetical protein